MLIVFIVAANQKEQQYIFIAECLMNQLILNIVPNVRVENLKGRIDKMIDKIKKIIIFLFALCFLLWLAGNLLIVGWKRMLKIVFIIICVLMCVSPVALVALDCGKPHIVDDRDINKNYNNKEGDS